jgi:hypothetical protein
MDINKPLVIFEMPELKNQRLQTKARLDAANAEWQRTKNGPRIEEKQAFSETKASPLS